MATTRTLRLASAATFVALAVLVVAIAAGLVVYVADVLMAVSQMRATNAEDLLENCQNATKLARFSWINHHCAQSRNAERESFGRQVLNLVIADAAAFLYILATEYQPFDASFVKFTVFVTLLLVVVLAFKLCLYPLQAYALAAAAPPQLAYGGEVRYLVHAPPSKTSVDE